MSNQDAVEAILAIERSALDRWSQGDPLGYLEVHAEDVTYFDDIGAQTRIDGVDALREYFRNTLEGNLPPHEYELVNPRVQLYGDTGILTLRYHPRGSDGTAMPAWKATSVYRRDDGAWRCVHAHWSMVKEA